MKMIEEKWNSTIGKYERTFLANSEEEVNTGLCGECAEGSCILVISTGNTYMKNASGKWQKMGTTEVLE